MSLVVQIVNGPLKGTRYRLRPGVRIGRKRGDVIIPDSRMSAVHASVAERSGVLTLVDEGSSNGIRVGKQRVNELVLTSGALFQLGETCFEVVREGPHQSVSGNRENTSPGQIINFAYAGW